MVRPSRIVSYIIIGPEHIEKLNPNLREKASLSGGELYISATGISGPDEPATGDIRVSYKVAPSMDVSVIAKQEGTSLVAYHTESGGSIALLKSGKVSASVMFGQEVSANRSVTFVMRIFGFVLFFIAVRFLLSGSLTAIGEIKVFKGLYGAGANVFSGIMALILTSVVIGAGWLVYRPGAVVIIAVGGAAAVAAILFVKSRGNSRKKETDIVVDIMKLAIKKGGRLSVTEVVVECGVDFDIAKKGLESLVSQGVAGMDVTDSGVMVYTFAEVQGLTD